MWSRWKIGITLQSSKSFYIKKAIKVGWAYKLLWNIYNILLIFLSNFLAALVSMAAGCQTNRRCVFVGIFK